MSTLKEILKEREREKSAAIKKAENLNGELWAAVRAYLRSTGRSRGVTERLTQLEALALRDRFRAQYAHILGRSTTAALHNEEAL